MLILTRKIGETMIIGDDIDISVLGVKGCQVRLGINAPKEISIHREEIYEKIQREKHVKQMSESDDELDGEVLISALVRKFGQSVNDDVINKTMKH